jgi:hypothetical protein
MLNGLRGAASKISVQANTAACVAAAVSVAGIRTLRAASSIGSIDIDCQLYAMRRELADDGFSSQRLLQFKRL